MMKYSVIQCVRYGTLRRHGHRCFCTSRCVRVVPSLTGPPRWKLRERFHCGNNSLAPAFNRRMDSASTAGGASGCRFRSMLDCKLQQHPKESMCTYPVLDLNMRRQARLEPGRAQSASRSRKQLAAAMSRHAQTLKP